MRTTIWLLIVVFATTAGELLVTRAMKQMEEVKNFSLRSIFRFLGQGIRKKSFGLGIVFLAMGFFSLLVLLSWNDVSFVIPATALGYVAGALGAKVFLGERLSSMRWMGIVLVTLGVALVALTNR
ncbi:MAG: EamA family transporter [Acidobacteriia bacterium]|nr:EamA family transporter [Terriglobia bacterium]